MELDIESETGSLLSPSVYSRSVKKKLVAVCCLPGVQWLLSMPVLMILCINVIVGASNATMMLAALETSFDSNLPFVVMVYVCLFVAVITLFSPLTGFLADVRCGRYKVVACSVYIMLAASLLLSLVASAILIHAILNTNVNIHAGVLWPFILVISVLGLVLFMFGLVSYQANFIPFGLDQLLEAPSISLAVFIHSVIWADRLGAIIMQVLDAVYICLQWSDIYPCVFVLTLTIFFIVITVCFRKCRFNVESQHHNPYRMIYEVLSFARRHRYPIQRSAFTYCDDEMPSRLDFAKDRFGGPFTTEQVEDVKTLFRILSVLLALGPIFVLEIPTSFFVTTIFGSHIGDRNFTSKPQVCSSQYILLERGTINNISSLVLSPLFIWMSFSVFRRRMSSIFTRLCFAVVVYLLGVASMACIDLVGHMVTEHGRESNHTMCMFVFHHRRNHSTLGLPVYVLLIPGLLLGLGSPLVMATTFEFISAQSPSSMKGLLVGVFFTIKAFFQLVSGVALVPFTLRHVWAESESMKDHPPVTNCGFGYLLFTCVVAMIGVVLLTVAVKKYKYRERDDRPYDQRFVVDVYGRYIEQARNMTPH